MQETDNFIIHTGSIIQEYLKAHNVSQKDAAKLMGTTTKHLSNIIRGKSALTTEMAIALENAIPDVPASYWINYEGRYQEYKAKCPAYKKIPADKLALYKKRFRFKDVFKGTDLSDLEMAGKMLAILGLESFEDFLPSCQTQAAFLRDKGEDEAVEIWIRLCLSEIDGQNPPDLPDFDIDAIEGWLPTLRDLSLNSDTQQSLEDCRYVLNQMGIRLVFHEPLPGSGVRGASLVHDNAPAILYSGRFKTHDQVWFTIAHELGHIRNGDIEEGALVAFEDTYDEDSDRESAANAFARKLFLTDEKYNIIQNEIAETNDGELVGTILRLAAKYEVHPGILSGRLARDGDVTYPQVSRLRS